MTNTVKEMANLLDKGEEWLKADSQNGKELLIDELKSAMMSRLNISSLIIKHEERREE